ncbi:MAG: hypothetical protein ACQES9_04060 [Myxococcota bacterium]
MMFSKRILSRISMVIAAFIFMSCASSPSDNNNENNTNNTNNQHQICEPSEESGFYLVSVGKVDFEIITGEQVVLKAMVVQRTESENHEDGLAAGYELQVEVIAGGEGGTLSSDTMITDANGMATVEFSGTNAGSYKILVSGEGVCSRQYSVEVRDILARLEALDNPSVTYIGRRISMGVRAYTMIGGSGEQSLSNQPVTFELVDPQGADTILEDSSGTQNQEITVNTDVGGTASILFNTGTAPYTANIRATLDGLSVEPVLMQVEVQDNGSGGPCENNIDCPAVAPICEDGVCIEVTGDGSCTTDDDCISPYVCVGEACVPPGNGEKCNLLTTANPCPDGQECIGGYCVNEPGNCSNNDDCPTGFLCEDGICVGEGEDNCYEVPCSDPNDVCINGVCTNPDDCNLQDSPTRLGGTWNFDSMLHLRDAVHPILGGILTASEVLRDIILGNFSISGIPSWLMSAVNDFLQDLISEYVPGWAQDLIVALGDVSDIVDDMRVLHTVNLVAMGNDEYYGTQVWDMVEFEYRGNYVSSPPEDILGFQVIPEDFTSREICGTFYIDQYSVQNVVGGLIRWAIDVVVTGVTCSNGGPCYYSLEDALEDIIDCDSIAIAIDDLIYSIWSDAPSVYGAVYTACDNNKMDAIDEIIQALDNIEVSLNLLRLRGVSPIVDDNNMQPGSWYGTLSGGNFDGEFTAVKQ